jgi:ABC-type Fe3+-siderophore transport system permease subunit
MLLAFATFGLVTIGAALSRWQSLSMAFLVGSGLALTTAFSTLNSLVQEMAPDALRSRMLWSSTRVPGDDPFGSLSQTG